MADMFSTYCPTCQTMVLLGTRRIAQLPDDGGLEGVLLRCTCGTLVGAADRAPEATAQTPTSSDLAEAS